VQVAYAIGKAHPVGFYVETFGTEQVPATRSRTPCCEVFDLRPAAIIRDLDLQRPDLRPDRGVRPLRPRPPGFTWESTDRADALAAAVRGRAGRGPTDNSRKRILGVVEKPADPFDVRV
jgi:S-adenosylmethionine synthetase